MYFSTRQFELPKLLWASLWALYWLLTYPHLNMGNIPVIPR